MMIYGIRMDGIMCRRDYNLSTVNLLKLRISSLRLVAPPTVVSWKLQKCKTVKLHLTFVFHRLPAFPAMTFKVKVEYFFFNP